MRHSNRINRAAGFSLVELMTALVAGMIVSAAVITFTMASFRSNSEYVMSTRLTQELRNSMDLVTRDLRRAGYDQNAMSRIASGSASPFSAMQMGDVQGDGTYQCVIYAYDRTNEAAGSDYGQVDTDNGEVRAVRRKVVKFNGNDVGVIEYAVSKGSTRPTCGGATADYTTFPPACNDTSHWCALSDPSLLNITGFALTDSRSTVGTAPNQVVLRDIGVSMSGRLANAADVRTVSSDVRVRSDCYDATLSNCNLSP